MEFDREEMEGDEVFISITRGVDKADGEKRIEKSIPTTGYRMYSSRWVMVRIGRDRDRKRGRGGSGGIKVHSPGTAKASGSRNVEDKSTRGHEKTLTKAPLYTGRTSEPWLSQSRQRTRSHE